MNNWRKFWRLSREERTLLVAALVFLPAVRLGLKVLGLRRVQSALGLGRANAPAPLANDDTAIMQSGRVAHLVALAQRYAGGTCLARSLVLACFLDRKGIPARLRIGVSNDDRRFQAHCWVEVAGVALNERPDVSQQYAAFDQNFAAARIEWR